MWDHADNQLGSDAEMPLAALVAHRQRELFGYARFLVGDGEAEDLLQDVFVQLARRRRACTLVYAMRSIRNRAVDAARSRSVGGPRAPRQLLFEIAADEAADHAEVREAFATLPDAEAEVLLLSVVGGLPVRATAGVLSKPVGTVAGLRARGLRMLGDAMSESEKSHERA